jgi:hypothetical protein
MTPEEIEAAAIRPLIKNTDTTVQETQPEPKLVITPVVRVEQRSTKVKIVGRSQYMRDMLTVEKQ